MTDRVDFSLAQLRYFVASAEVGNISDAAERLHASQSAVSAAIQRLERQLGTQLLHRHRAKGISLTPSGRLLLVEAKALLRQAGELQLRSRSLQSALQGSLEVACSPAIGPFVLPRTLSTLRHDHPDLDVTVHEEPEENLYELVRAGRCELAVTYEGRSGNLVFRGLADLPLRGLVAHGHPLARVGRATVSELSAETLVTTAVQPLDAVLERVFRQAGVPVPPVVRTSGLETMLGLVAEGVGFALMWQRPGRTALCGGRIAPVDIVADRPYLASLGVATMPGVRPSGRARTFTEALETTVHELYRAS